MGVCLLMTDRDEELARGHRIYHEIGCSCLGPSSAVSLLDLLRMARREGELAMLKRCQAVAREIGVGIAHGTLHYGNPAKAVDDELLTIRPETPPICQGGRDLAAEANDLYLASRRGFDAFKAALASMLERLGDAR